MTIAELTTYLEGQFADLRRRIDCLEAKLFKGNGQPPIATRLSLLEANCQAVQAAKQTKGKKAWEFTKLLIAAALAVAGAKYVA